MAASSVHLLNKRKRERGGHWAEHVFVEGAFVGDDSEGASPPAVLAGDEEDAG